MVGLLLGRVPAFFGVVDTVAGLAVAVGLAYFGFRLIVLAQRRLLWRVRRKLTLSYIFIGFVPMVLVVVFFMLCVLLLFFNVSSYLVQSRVNALVDETRFLAEATAIELEQTSSEAEFADVLRRRQEAAASRYRGA